MPPDERFRTGLDSNGQYGGIAVSEFFTILCRCGINEATGLRCAFLRFKKGVIAGSKDRLRSQGVYPARFVQFKYTVIGLSPIGVPS